MAMIRGDYYVAGANHAEKLHAKGHLIAEGFPILWGKMAVAMSGSWQAMAFKEGFSDRRARLHAPARTTNDCTLTNPAERRRGKQIDEMVEGYIRAMLWSSTDVIDGEDIESLEAYEVAEETRTKALDICTRFYDANRTDLGAYADLRGPVDGHTAYECAGHDLWLTTAGHGVGFWDRGMGGLGKRLSDQCGFHKPFPSLDAYVGDDGLVYLS